MHVAFVEALRQLENSREGAVTMWEHPFLHVKGTLFTPGEADTQSPHSQNELYIVMCGSGELLYEDKIIDIENGDLLFVPAGVWHKFINYTPDLLLWAIYFGEES